MKRHLALAAVLALLLALLSGCAGAPEPVRVSDGYRNYYEIFVRSFYDSNGDGIGDLNGVTAKLDYISGTLGADGIWLMPIHPSPTYHKYDVTDYNAVDPAYGSLDDFDALIAAAAERDIRVIIDLVVNHTSNLHPWFSQAVSALWKNEPSEYIDYYNFTRENPGTGYSKITDTYYYECRFVSGMPDLNLDNPAVREELLDIARFWLERGVAGFRLDAVTSFYTGKPEENIAFLAWLNDAIKADYPEAYLVGEAWSESGAIANYYASGLDSFFNFPYAQATGRITGAINQKDGLSFARGIAAWNEQIKAANPQAKDALFLSNHDHARSAGFLMRSLPRQKLAASLYLLAPGNPFIYYGEELGLTGSGIDENKRLPMLWTSDGAGRAYPPPGATQAVEGIEPVDRQLKDKDSLLAAYQKILAIKARYPEIARGDVRALDVKNPGVAVLAMTGPDRTVYVVHNLLEESCSVDLADGGLSAAALDSLELADYLVTQRGRPRLKGSVLTLPPMSTGIILGRHEDG